MIIKKQVNGEIEVCYWDDYCCDGCNDEKFKCEDYSPLYECNDNSIEYIENVYSWSDSITEAWLNGEDITDDRWWLCSKKVIL